MKTEMSFGVWDSYSIGILQIRKTPYLGGASG